MGPGAKIWEGRGALGTVGRGEMMMVLGEVADIQDGDGVWGVDAQGGCGAKTSGVATLAAHPARPSGRCWCTHTGGLSIVRSLCTCGCGRRFRGLHRSL